MNHCVQAVPLSVIQTFSCEVLVDVVEACDGLLYDTAIIDVVTKQTHGNSAVCANLDANQKVAMKQAANEPWQATVFIAQSNK